MRNLKVTLIQCEQFWEDKAQNLAYFDKLLEQVKETDLILFPEMFHTGFSMNAVLLAENMGDSEALTFLKQIAREKNAAVYTSFICEEAGHYFNRGVFVFPEGKIEVYDKRKLFTLAKEEETYTAGKKPMIVTYKTWNINLQICYDLRFPEISRNSLDSDGKSSYDICLYVANWPEKRSSHWKVLLPARAIENQCFVLGLNRIGTDGKGLVYSGDSAVYSPLGEKLSLDASHETKIIQVELNKQSIDDVRANLNFLKDV